MKRLMRGFCSISCQVIAGNRAVCSQDSGALQNTELKFDLVSPVDELAKQIRMEFDFLA